MTTTVNIEHLRIYPFEQHQDKTNHVESRYASKRTTLELRNPNLQSKKQDSRFSDQITELEQSHHPSLALGNKTKTNVKNINEKNITKTRSKN